MLPEDARQRGGEPAVPRAALSHVRRPWATASDRRGWLQGGILAAASIAGALVAGLRRADWAVSEGHLALARHDVVACGCWQHVDDVGDGDEDCGTNWSGVVPEEGPVGEKHAALNSGESAPSTAGSVVTDGGI